MKAVALVTAGVIVGAFAAEPSPRIPVPGYLAADALDVTAILPAPPVSGDARDRPDREIFLATRALQGSPRWEQAAEDARASAADLYRGFSCALGVTVAPGSAPRLTMLLQRSTRDAGRAIEASKAYYRRSRPYAVDTGAICRPREETGDSFDYPSGHSLVGWTWAQILAEVAPARAGAVLARGRAFGESRIVCGVHNYSAVVAGQLAASALVAALHGSAEFRADVEAARAELAALAGTGADPAAPAACALERQLMAPLLAPTVASQPAPRD